MVQSRYFSGKRLRKWEHLTSNDTVRAVDVINLNVGAGGSSSRYNTSANKWIFNAEFEAASLGINAINIDAASNAAADMIAVERESGCARGTNECWLRRNGDTFEYIN